jgi:hypothetical protein
MGSGATSVGIALHNHQTCRSRWYKRDAHQASAEGAHFVGTEGTYFVCKWAANFAYLFMSTVYVHKKQQEFFFLYGILVSDGREVLVAWKP